MIGFQSWNVLLIFGAAAAVVLLASPSQMQLVFSSHQSQDPGQYKGSQIPSTNLVRPIVPGEQQSNGEQSQGGSQDGAPGTGDSGGGGNTCLST
jgi:hypothetical protein